MKLTKKLLLATLIPIFLVSMTMINVTLASPETYFWVDPPVVSFPSGNFLITINVADAPPSYAWETYLSWDPNLLELGYVKEGDFLHRWAQNPFPPPDYLPKYKTQLAYTPLNEANAEGKILLTCTLVAALPMSAWASGNGQLVTLGFTVEAEGNSALNLFQARLWDHLEGIPPYPAPTNYDNVDAFVETSPPFASASIATTGWKLKVNGKAGISEEGGHKTTVGEENLLEARVENTGPLDVYVQVLFEIRDAAGQWIATAKSDIFGPLPAGELTKLNATWTAKRTGLVYITAYLSYSMFGPPFAPTIADGFTRTVRLKILTA